MKSRVLIIIGIVLAPLIMPNVSASCAAGALEWWEPCNDAGQNDIFSFKANLIIMVSMITGIVFIFLAVRKRKNKHEN